WAYSCHRIREQSCIRSWGMSRLRRSIFSRRARKKRKRSSERGCADKDAVLKHTLRDEPKAHHGWTIMLISAGIGLIALCLLIPQSDENRLMAYQCQKLKMDLEHLDKQVAVNQEFIDRL